MRLVIFTSNGALQESVWWQALEEADDLESVMICQKIERKDLASVARRFVRNVQRHGFAFVPIRVALLLISILRPARQIRGVRQRDDGPLDVRVIKAHNIHAPEVIAQVRDFAPNLGLSIGAPILRASLFTVPALGTINVHLGKVPDYRGAPPAFWEINAGAGMVGATIHWVDEGLDTGDVIASGELPLYHDDTLTRAVERLEELGVALLRRSLAQINSGTVSSSRQPNGGQTNRQPTVSRHLALTTRIALRRARARLRTRSLVKYVLMVAALHVYRPIRDVWRTLRRRHPVRIFTFHRVSSMCRDGMTIRAAEFERQVDYLIRTHDIVTLEAGVMAIREGSRQRRPAAVLTFDDAYRSVFTTAYPILANRGITACCFVSTDYVGGDERFPHDEANLARPFLEVMNWEELRKLRNEGWSIGAHTASHARLSQCFGSCLERELHEPPAELYARLGVVSPTLAFPFGRESDFSEAALVEARRAGYRTVFSDYAGENRTGTAAVVLGRFDIGGDHDSIAWKILIHGLDFSRLGARWR